ncbi:hypothetical protein M086_2104, partial [Bacteroides fragilis str. S13 L11]
MYANIFNSFKYVNIIYNLCPFGFLHNFRNVFCNFHI